MIINKFILTYINEHYSDYPAVGLNEIFKLDLTKSDLDVSKTIIEEDKATIILSGKTFEIEFIDDYYVIRKYFKDYAVVSYFELDQTCYMKNFSFDVDDKNKIVLESIDVEDAMQSLTIKNIVDDKVVMERENSHAIVKKSICTSRYNENEEGKYLEKYIVDEAGNNLYSLFTTTFNNNVLSDSIHGRTDIAVSYNGKKEIFTGKITDYDDLLKETETFRNPNVIVRLLVCVGNVISYYKVYVIKKDNKLHFYMKSNKVLTIDSLGNMITDNDIKLIKENIEYIINNNAVYYVENGLDRINSSCRIEDYVDFQLCSSKNALYLAFDIYEHRDLYFKGKDKQVNL